MTLQEKPRNLTGGSSSGESSGRASIPPQDRDLGFGSVVAAGRGTVLGLAVALAVAGPTPPATAADWPEFRGTGRSGRSPAALPAGTDLRAVERWRRPLGPGFSGVLIVGDALYTMTSDLEREFLVRLHAETGEEVWRLEIGPLFENSWGDGPRSTPTYRDGRLFALGSHGRLLAADADQGREIWRIELGAIAGVAPPDFGYSPSPLLSGHAVMTEVGANDSGLIRAFDSATGEPLWAVESGRAGYSSPIELEMRDGRRLAIFLTREAAVGISEGGEIAWRWPLEGASPFDSPIAPPVALTGDRIFLSHRAQGGSALLAATPTGVATLWESPRMISHFHAPVEVGGTLYGFHNATLQALDPDDGSVLWRRRGFGKGSIVAVGEPSEPCPLAENRSST